MNLPYNVAVNDLPDHVKVESSSIRKRINLNDVMNLPGRTNLNVDLSPVHTRKKPGHSTAGTDGSRPAYQNSLHSIYTAEFTNTIRKDSGYRDIVSQHNETLHSQEFNRGTAKRDNDDKILDQVNVTMNHPSDIDNS